MKDLVEIRKSICEKCPLYKVDKFYGPICDSSKYISPDGQSFSYFRKDGWTRGCGCHMKHKWANLKAKCIVGKW